MCNWTEMPAALKAPSETTNLNDLIPTDALCWLSDRKHSHEKITLYPRLSHYVLLLDRRLVRWIYRHIRIMVGVIGPQGLKDDWTETDSSLFHAYYLHVTLLLYWFVDTQLIYCIQALLQNFSHVTCTIAKIPLPKVSFVRALIQFKAA